MANKPVTSPNPPKIPKGSGTNPSKPGGAPKGPRKPC